MKEKNFKKSILKERESSSKPNYIARISSKGQIPGLPPLVRYSGPFLKWTREELQQTDKRTRKPMPMWLSLPHLVSDVSDPQLSDFLS